MDTPTTALSRVEQVLQRSEMGLTIQRITQDAGVTEKEAKASIRALHAMGQIEMIPTPGRWGPRYAWLAVTPVAAEPPAIPDEDLAAGVQEAITGDGSGEALPILGDDIQKVIVKALTETHEAAPDGLLTGAFGGPISLPSINADTLMAQMADYRSAHYRNEPTRYAVAVPRRPLRIVKTRARAEALALAAVRNGAKSAEVFSMAPLGRARRGAEWYETAS